MRELATALLLTLALEIPIVLLLSRGGFRPGFCALVNLLTNPLLNCALAWLTSAGVSSALRKIALLLLELAAFVYEGAMYSFRYGIRGKKPYLVSLAANAVSFILGSAALRFL